MHALLCLLMLAPGVEPGPRVEEPTAPAIDGQSDTTLGSEPGLDPLAEPEPGSEPEAPAEPEASAEPDPPIEPEPPAKPDPPAPAEPIPTAVALADPPTPHPARAVAPASPRRSWAVGAFVDAGYVFNHNLPDNHVNRGLVTAPRTGELTVPMVVGHLQHEPTEAEPWQLELALQFGPAATALLAADPRPGRDASQFTGVEVLQHIGRANVGGRIPRAGTEVTAGVMAAPLGYWSWWTKDNWTVSTPWHLNASPYVLMGARVLQPVGERVTLHAWVTNGWQTYADVNRVPSYLGGVSAEPIDGLQVGSFVYFGPDDRDPKARAFRVLSDSWAVYDAGRWGLAGMFNVMRERLTLEPDEPVAFYMAGAVSPRVRLWQSTRDERQQWFLAARGEAFWDRDGRIYGVDQLLGSAAIDTDVQLFGHLLVRLEYRYDRSTSAAGYFYRGRAIRDTDVGLGRDQHTIYLMTTGYFEHWFGLRERSSAGVGGG